MQVSIQFFFWTWGTDSRGILGFSDECHPGLAAAAQRRKAQAQCISGFSTAAQEQGQADRLLYHLASFGCKQKQFEIERNWQLLPVLIFAMLFYHRTRPCCQCVAFWLFGDGGDSWRNSDFAALEGVMASHGSGRLPWVCASISTRTRPVKAVETPSLLLPTWSLCDQPEVHMTCIKR